MNGRLKVFDDDDGEVVGDDGGDVGDEGGIMKVMEKPAGLSCVTTTKH